MLSGVTPALKIDYSSLNLIRCRIETAYAQAKSAKLSIKILLMTDTFSGTHTAYRWNKGYSYEIIAFLKNS